MTEAEKREKVISGLKYCLDRSEEKVHCGDCPYWQDDFESGCHIYDMMRDALALLKEQEPRVLTKEEIVLCTDWVWCEYTSGGYQGWYKMEEYATDYNLIRWEDTTADSVDDYGFRWRAWTSRPSEQQMRDTKWEGEKE